jgi:hypothetical protein
MGMPFNLAYDPDLPFRSLRALSSCLLSHVPFPLLAHPVAENGYSAIDLILTLLASLALGMILVDVLPSYKSML